MVGGSGREKSISNLATGQNLRLGVVNLHFPVEEDTDVGLYMVEAAKNLGLWLPAMYEADDQSLRQRRLVKEVGAGTLAISDAQQDKVNRYIETRKHTVADP